MSDTDKKNTKQDLNESLVFLFEKLHNLKILLLLPVIFVGAVIFGNKINETTIFPSAEYDSIISYTDKTELQFDTTKINDFIEIIDTIRGVSEITSFSASDSAISFSYILKNGVQYPYAGVSINTISSKTSLLTNFSKYDSLEISLKSSGPVNLTLNGFWDGVTVIPSKNPIGRIYQNSMLIKGDTTVALDKFITPDWWFKKNNISVEKRAEMKFDISQIFSFIVENSDYENSNSEITVLINKISLKKNISLFNRTALIIFLFYIVLYGYFWKFGISHLGGPVVIPYRELKVTSYVDEDSKKIEEYVAENYSNTELTVKQASVETAITQSKIQVILRTQFKMTFRQYLNQIKIHESKRLLLETDRQVTDIAFRVGYKNVTHFNRIFKEMENLSPNQYRKANAKK